MGRFWNLVRATKLGKSLETLVTNFLVNPPQYLIDAETKSQAKKVPEGIRPYLGLDILATNDSRYTVYSVSESGIRMSNGSYGHIPMGGLEAIFGIDKKSLHQVIHCGGFDPLPHIELTPGAEMVIVETSLKSKSSRHVGRVLAVSNQIPIESLLALAPLIGKTVTISPIGEEDGPGMNYSFHDSYYSTAPVRLDPTIIHNNYVDHGTFLTVRPEDVDRVLAHRSFKGIEIIEPVKGAHLIFAPITSNLLRDFGTITDVVYGDQKKDGTSQPETMPHPKQPAEQYMAQIRSYQEAVSYLRAMLVKDQPVNGKIMGNPLIQAAFDAGLLAGSELGTGPQGYTARYKDDGARQLMFDYFFKEEFDNKFNRAFDGYMALKMNDPRRAIAQLSAALAIDPDYRFAQEHMAAAILALNK